MPKYLSISPSVLNNFHALRSGQYELWGKGPEDFLNDIIHGAEPNEAMSRGTAYGELLEHGLEKYAKPKGARVVGGGVSDAYGVYADFEYDYSDADGYEYHVYEKDLDRTWVFTGDEVRPVLEFRKAHPDCVYEVWSELEFDVDGETVKSRMRLDGLEYLTGYEFKTSSRAKGHTDRVDSYQWRMYLMANPELQELIYHEFQFMSRTKSVREVVHGFRPYPGMEDDVRNTVAECVRWLRQYPEAIAARTRDFD